MKKLLIASLLLMFASCNKSTTTTDNTTTSSDYYYICTGKYAETYHISKDCWSLNNCRADIEEVTLDKAEEQDRRPCKLYVEIN